MRNNFLAAGPWVPVALILAFPTQLKAEVLRIAYNSIAAVYSPPWLTN